MEHSIKIIALTLLTIFVLGAGKRQEGDEQSNGEKQCKRYCSPCHSWKKGGIIVAASLYDIVETKKPGWIIKYTLNEEAYMKKERGKQYRNLEGVALFDHKFKEELKEKDVLDIIDYIKSLQ